MEPYRISLCVVGIDVGFQPILKVEEGKATIQHSGQAKAGSPLANMLSHCFVKDQAALDFFKKYQDRIEQDLKKDKLPGRYRQDPCLTGVTQVPSVRCYQKDGVLYWSKPK